jgi:hypothetical protein
MANMTVNQRNQFERIDLSVPTTGTHVRNSWRVSLTTVIGLAILGVLGYAAAEALDSWWAALVLAAIGMNVIGAMIAISPNRRA